MKFFKSPFSYPSHQPTPVVASSIPIHSWRRQLRDESTRFIRNIEMCTAAAAGDDFWVTPTDQSHLHTLLRVKLEPQLDVPDISGILFVERVLSSGGSYHSVTPLKGAMSDGGSLFLPEVHDQICIFSDGPSAAPIDHLQVERTLTFGDSSGSRLTLADFALILELVSQETELLCTGGDCKFQSRSFAFMCMTALTPRLPPSTSARKPGELVGTNVKSEEDIDDSVFELGAATLLGQIPRVSGDPASMQALRLIESLKDQPKAWATPKLYH